MIIKDISFSIESIKLNSSYNLSYKKLLNYESIVTKITLLDSNVLFGEVTPLYGYTDETVEDVVDELSSIIPLVIGKNVNDAIESLYGKIHTSNSFALSALIPPLEIYKNNTEVSTKNMFINKKDLVYALSIEQSQEALIEEIKRLSSDGYETIKIKIGKNLNKELDVVDLLSKINLNNLKIRFDANGGYTYNESVLLLSKLEIILKNVEYLEQPLCRKCWSELETLIKLNKNIPIMIDESIYTIDDIRRSFDIGARFIKIKLCKFASLKKLQEVLDYACSLGLKVVFGNGVATDISNFYEFLFFYKNKNKIYGAIESVGFLKINKFLKYNLKERLLNE